MPPVVGAVIAIVVSIGGAADRPNSPASPGTPLTGSNNTGHPPAGDVTVAGCEINAATFPVAHLEIRNNTSEASKYFVTVEFTDPERVGDADYGRTRATSRPWRSCCAESQSPVQ
ncbi:hypothetical protein [Kitasatospora sp. NPDC057223]|uniref:hypothetical protein n=1 Tax=Kitasatospora sp. NPDC057223 TaxID=3346055 RepID=UPI003629F5EA